MAQLVEEVSVLVADKRRKEPRSLPRPWEGRLKRAQKSKPREEGLVQTAEGGMVATGLGGMLSATQMRGAVTLG